MNKEEINKKITSDSDNNKTEQNKKLLQKLKSAGNLLPELQQPFVLTPSLRGNKDNWTNIVQSFKAQFNIDPDSKGSLVFNSEEEAIQFFEAQALLGNEFLCQAVENGNPLDFYVFSCGNNQLYKGDFATIIQQLNADLVKNPGDQKIIDGLNKLETFNMRAQLNVGRHNETEENKPINEFTSKKS